MNEKIKEVNRRMEELSKNFDEKIRVQEIQYLNIIKTLKRKR